jgi:hypothetical protein
VSLVAKVQEEPTKLKTERNESHGFGLMCLDGSCTVETEYAAIARQSLCAFFNAAILGDQRSPDVSKLIREGANSESSIIEEGAKVDQIQRRAWDRIIIFRYSRSSC